MNSWGDFRPASVSPTNAEGVANVPPELTLKSPPGPARPQKSQHTNYDIQALPSPEKTILQPLPGPRSESPGPSHRSWYHVAGSINSFVPEHLSISKNNFKKEKQKYVHYANQNRNEMSLYTQ